MLLKQEGPFKQGLNMIAELNGNHSEMMMDFGILKLNKNDKYHDDFDLERVIMLIYGHIKVQWQDKEIEVKRDDYLEDDVWAINLPGKVPVDIVGLGDDTEMCVIRTDNDKSFDVHIFNQQNTIKEIRGKGFMNEADTRICRTMMDTKLSPHSNIVLGEDVHFPGRWSGYPNHYHPQPEIYFYKFHPENGYGLLKLGDEAVVLDHNCTVLIHPNKVHPQCTCPGYAMYYIWAIRNLPGNPYVSPIVDPAYAWCEQEGARYWPDDK